MSVSPTAPQSRRSLECGPIAAVLARDEAATAGEIPAALCLIQLQMEGSVG